jgi:hypothetical protein
MAKLDLEAVIRWPSAKDVCEQGKVTPNTAYAWAREAVVDAVRICGEWRFDPVSLEKVLRQRAERRAARQKKAAQQ